MTLLHQGKLHRGCISLCLCRYSAISKWFPSLFTTEVADLDHVQVRCMASDAKPPSNASRPISADSAFPGLRLLKCCTGPRAGCGVQLPLLEQHLC